MRAGGCTVQQALTPEAATLVKQAITLARRRGHAQVTPLHVANTMLSSSTGLLRIACLQSHSHPLQCKALELCFNVALNRLPASSSSGPMPGTHLYNHHHYPPSLSNALIAAFKRAQAHQRRGSIETQQQPLLAVKIELEQLIISILDDPSVSRVMREAGFSSTQVKSNVEQALSLEASPPAPTEDEDTNLLTRPEGRNEDVRSLIDCLMSRRKRSIVLVGESLSATEGVMKGVMEMINKEEVPDFLRNLHLVTLPLDSFSFMSREEVDHKVRELRCLVKRGGILFLGDLKWAAQYKLGGEGKGRSHYRPVEHVIMEISNLLMREGGSGRFWVMGIATYQTYMRCRIGNPSLEAVWGLQPLAVPAGSLELSLKLDSKKIRAGPSWSLLEGAENQLKCCAECSLKFEAEARALPNISSTSHGSITSKLPSWLQQYKDERKKEASNDQGWIQNLCNKWNTICYSSHKHQTLNFSSISPSSSISSYNNHHSSCFHVQTHEPWPVPLRTMNPRTSEPDHWLGKGLELMSNPNSSSSSDTMDTKPLNKFKELNAENVKILCNTLERKVPWQGNIIPKVVSTILQCRSGMVRRKERSILAGMKEETWLLFLGGDVNGKEKVARELASLVFHSRASVVSIGFSGFASTRSGSNEDGLNNKRSRSEPSHGYLERFAEAISDNPHRVILMEGIEQVDSSSQMGIKTAIERGRIMRSNGEELNVCDAIIILCCESFDSISRACSPRAKQKSESDEGKDEDGEKEMSSFLCLDLDLNLSVGDDCSFDDVGLLEAVDGTFFFKSPEL